MITEFCKRVLVSPDEIFGRSRKQDNVDARHMYFYILRENGFTLEKIGRLSGFNHATVIHGIKHIKDLLDSGDMKIKKMYHLVKDIKR
jgi:chromosomal replication initiation ATPase DnaA